MVRWSVRAKQIFQNLAKNNPKIIEKYSINLSKVSLQKRCQYHYNWLFACSREVLGTVSVTTLQGNNLRIFFKHFFRFLQQIMLKNVKNI